MNTVESKECLSLLTDLFPQADLQIAELEVFRDALTRFARSEAIDAIRTHRLTAKFNRPTFGAILADLYERRRKNSSGAPVQQHQTFADIIRQANPQLANRSAAELVMRYHRREWFIYSKPMRDVADKRELNDKEMLQLADRQASIISACERDLWALPGFDRARAERSAVFVVDSQHNFELALDDIGNGADAQEVADAIA